jgi:predicted PurR-regulated permease PerM
MPTFFARLIIIVIVLLLLILLRKFLRRVVFIVILLAVAFFMYGLFSPSGASKLWYSVKNFPQRVASYLGGEAYHSYDEVANEVVQEVPEISTPKEPEQLAKSSETPAKEMQISKNFKKLTVS